MVATWDPHTHPIVSEVAGKVAFESMEEGITVREQTDEITGLSSISIIDPAERASSAKELRPAVNVVDKKGKEVCSNWDYKWRSVMKVSPSELGREGNRKRRSQERG